ncbi:unnamed protein product, partial [Laminaria digitata]
MTTKLIRPMAAVVIAAGLAMAPQAMAADAADMQKLLQEVQALKKSYEARTAELEKKLKQLEAKQTKKSAEASTSSPSGRDIKDNSFNPSIGVILNGRASSFTRDSSEIAGFGVGEEGERGSEGLALDESELNFSANVDDKFYGSLTAAIVREDGSDKVELEEAYIETLPGAGLPDGARAKAGRAFWTFGYLNEHHAHSDDFADRPLT